MEKSKSARIIKSASALLAVVIIVVVMLLINQRRRIAIHREEVLREKITQNAEYDIRLNKFMGYADSKAGERAEILAVRQSDYENFSYEEYGMAQISMWDVSALSAETYQNLFGMPAQYAGYLYTTPMELKEYLTTILESGNEVEHMYINIDPYQLERNYAEAYFYDSEAVSFEEYIHNEIFPILDEYPDVRFELFLPARPVSYWASMSVSDYSDILEKWYDFLMYLHWCPNAEVRYLGDAEWLVANDLNYVSPERLKDDVMQKVYIYLYAYEKYEITPPELKQKKSNIDKYIRKYINGEYDICDLSGQKVVFLGDSLFDYVKADSAAVPGVVQRMTQADCYNLSIGGTAVSAIDPSGFTRIANALGMRSTIDLDSRYKREAERFLKDYSEDDSLYFVILYGMNDYFSNIPITEDDLDESSDDEGYTADSTFTYSLEYGVKALKAAYPEATILLLSPYPPVTHEGGTVAYQEGGRTLVDYIKAIRNVSKSEAVTFLDLYHDGTIKKSNNADYMDDEVHANETGAFAIGEDIARKLGELTAE